MMWKIFLAMSIVSLLVASFRHEACKDPEVTSYYYIISGVSAICFLVTLVMNLIFGIW